MANIVSVKKVTYDEINTYMHDNIEDADGGAMYVNGPFFVTRTRYDEEVMYTLYIDMDGKSTLLCRSPLLIQAVRAINEIITFSTRMLTSEICDELYKLS